MGGLSGATIDCTWVCRDESNPMCCAASGCAVCRTVQLCVELVSTESECDERRSDRIGNSRNDTGAEENEATTLPTGCNRTMALWVE